MRKSQSTAMIRQGGEWTTNSPSETVGLMGNLAVGNTASNPWNLLTLGEKGAKWAKTRRWAKIGRNAGKLGEMGEKWAKRKLANSMGMLLTFC